MKSDYSNTLPMMKMAPDGDTISTRPIHEITSYFEYSFRPKKDNSIPRTIKVLDKSAGIIPA